MINHPGRRSNWNPTKSGLEFSDWWLLANAALAKVNLRGSRFKEAKDAYEMGDSPNTFAAYVAGIDGWNEQYAPNFRVFVNEGNSGSFDIYELEDLADLAEKHLGETGSISLRVLRIKKGA